MSGNHLPPPKPVRGPMVPSGTVEPPKPSGKLSGKDRRALRIKAEAFLQKLMASGTPYLLAAFAVKPNGDGVTLHYECEQFPFALYGEAAELFAKMLERMLPPVPAPAPGVEPEAPPEPEQPAANEIDALPSSL